MMIILFYIEISEYGLTGLCGEQFECLHAHYRVAFLI